MAKTWEVGMANKQKKKKLFCYNDIYHLVSQGTATKKGETKKEIMEKLNTYKKKNACWKIVV